MIAPEQLAQALDRIHPRDRELLSLSLRRRVPDDALGRLYECDSTEVARRRARAIEQLADEMDLQRGEDLGAVLQALLEPGTWSAVAASVGEEFAVEAGGGRLTAIPLPDDAEIKASGPALAPVPVPAEGSAEEEKEGEASGEEATAGGDEAPAEEPAEAEAEAEAAPTEEPAPAEAEAAPAEEPAPAEAAPPSPAQPATPEAPAESVTPAAHPVLEMLAAREREAPDPPKRAVPLALIGLSVASLVGAAGVVGATQFGETTRIVQTPKGGGGGDDDTTRHFIPAAGGPLAAPFPTDPREVSCYSTAFVPQATVLYTEPGGHKRLKITPKTEWGSPRVLGVLKQRGSWLGVQAAELRNHEIAWVKRGDARVDCVRWSLHADLSKRTLFVRRDGHTVRKMKVAVGRPGNATPKGRFTVTDKLRVTDGNSPYGCCVLALSGHQTHLPEYWPGGDRLAIHATSDESSIGKPVSLGCMRAQARRARWLIYHIPLGAPVFIKA